ncbi:FAD-dependent oxidoreductase [Actinomadura sp. SCN-SB]|uniref:FAD-dependent oxidoreductase n=1 Tax=Actinomadura sp. SCN-SB TaxID=3373092 RepID=UPI0037523649
MTLSETPNLRGTDRPVIVVGGGPVGMTAAARLAAAGTPVVLVEANAVPLTDWRASTFHAATLELLDGIEITSRMHAEGLVVPLYHFRDRRDGLIAEFDFRLLSDETPYPYRLQLNQQHLVRFLYERLREDDGVELLFGSRVVDTATTADGVAAVVETPDGTRTITGTHLIGADGPRSTVRRTQGIGFPGFTYPERFLIVSTTVELRDLIPDLAHVNYIADPVQWLFVLRTPESWRVVLPVSPDEPIEKATAPERLQETLQGVAPNPDGYPIVDHQAYNVHQRVASTFRSGNIVIAGDAAHINSPIGGVGLNSGIHDVMDATERILRIRAGDADPDAELDAYDTVRRRIAIEYVQADTQRNTERLKETDESARRATHEEMRATAADPERARAYMRRVSLLESVRRFGIGRPPEAIEELEPARRQNQEWNETHTESRNESRNQEART